MRKGETATRAQVVRNNDDGIVVPSTPRNNEEGNEKGNTKQTTLDTTAMKMTHKEQRRLFINAVSEFVTHNMLPFTHVECPALRKMIEMIMGN